MTVIDKLIAVLESASAQGGLDEHEVRAQMGWSPTKVITPYMTLARRSLRKSGSAFTIPYLRAAGGDKYRLVQVIDTEAQESAKEQTKSAQTRIEEVAAEQTRLGDRHAYEGNAVEAKLAYRVASDLERAASLLSTHAS